MNLEPIGQGAFGTVYRAFDPKLNREFAVKLYPVADSAIVLPEARMLARIRHSNVVTVYGAGEDSCYSGFWMEFIDGETLATLVERNGPFSPAESSAILTDLLDGLAAVHAIGLVHGDIKAQNTMRERGGRVVLLDFGLGLPRNKIRGHWAGTPVYMAPELTRSPVAAPTADIYAAGVLLFFLLTGRFPVSQQSRFDVREVRPEVPEQLAQIVSKATGLNPADRFSSPIEMQRALRCAMLDRGKKQWSRRGLLVAGLGLAIPAGYASYRYLLQPRATGNVLLIAPIENSTADPSLSAIGEVLRVQIGQSTAMTVWGDAKVELALRSMGIQSADIPASAIREIALRSGPHSFCLPLSQRSEDLTL